MNSSEPQQDPRSSAPVVAVDVSRQPEAGKARTMPTSSEDIKAVKALLLLAGSLIAALTKLVTPLSGLPKTTQTIVNTFVTLLLLAFLFVLYWLMGSGKDQQKQISSKTIMTLGQLSIAVAIVLSVVQFSRLNSSEKVSPETPIESQKSAMVLYCFLHLTWSAGLLCCGLAIVKRETAPDASATPSGPEKMPKPTNKRADAMAFLLLAVERAEWKFISNTHDQPSSVPWRQWRNLADYMDRELPVEHRARALSRARRWAQLTWISSALAGIMRTEAAWFERRLYLRWRVVDNGLSETLEADKQVADATNDVEMFGFVCVQWLTILCLSRAFGYHRLFAYNREALTHAKRLYDQLVKSNRLSQLTSIRSSDSLSELAARLNPPDGALQRQVQLWKQIYTNLLNGRFSGNARLLFERAVEVNERLGALPAHNPAYTQAGIMYDQLLCAATAAARAEDDPALFYKCLEVLVPRARAEGQSGQARELVGEGLAGAEAWNERFPKDPWLERMGLLERLNGEEQGAPATYGGLADSGSAEKPVSDPAKAQPENGGGMPPGQEQRPTPGVATPEAVSGPEKKPNEAASERTPNTSPPAGGDGTSKATANSQASGKVEGALKPVDDQPQSSDPPSGANGSATSA
jgi:hypothetical protein